MAGKPREERSAWGGRPAAGAPGVLQVFPTVIDGFPRRAILKGAIQAIRQLLVKTGGVEISGSYASGTGSPCSHGSSCTESSWPTQESSARNPKVAAEGPVVVRAAPQVIGDNEAQPVAMPDYRSSWRPSSA